jgi:hypothetical protein
MFMVWYWAEGLGTFWTYLLTYQRACYLFVVICKNSLGVELSICFNGGASVSFKVTSMYDMMVMRRNTL